MSPLNYDRNERKEESRILTFDEERDKWEFNERQSSFSEINRIALRGTENVVNSNDYTKTFRRYVRNETKKLRDLERQQNRKNIILLRVLPWIWNNTFARLGEDWVCLALLGIFMALLSVGVDIGIQCCSTVQIWWYRDLTSYPFISYLAWITLPLILIIFTVAFVKMLAPQSVGSGIPEVKTIMRGFPIKNHLTFKTLIAKVIGLTATLGSGLPLGKEAPFVHIACIVARMMNKLTLATKGIYKDDTQNTEMLIAGCAVGISCCFASPIGGVLYSVEATSTYFPVRNYWRAFFAAVCSSIVFRLHAVWSNHSDTISALFTTNFNQDFPFHPQELFIFVILGLICGFLGSLWVYFFRQYTIFLKTNKIMSKLIQTNIFLYPIILVTIISSISYPFGIGTWVGGDLSTHDQMTQLFSNFTWTQPNLTDVEVKIVGNWSNGGNENIILHLLAYFLYTFIFTVMASTLPIPGGTFIPLLKMGGSLGRLIGEGIHLCFPYGVYMGERQSPIIPGCYAVVGAAAFVGAATHTVSVAVMALEMTGQISLIAPILIGVLFSNAIAVHLSPSIYDTMISLKKLPYMPDLLPSKREMHDIIVENFMVKDVKYIWQKIKFSSLISILKENEGLQHFPLVESLRNTVLLGSVPRHELIKIIYTQISQQRFLEDISELTNELLSPNSTDLETIKNSIDRTLVSGSLQNSTLNNVDSLTSNSTCDTTITCTSTDNSKQKNLDATTQKSFVTFKSPIDSVEESTTLLSNSSSLRVTSVISTSEKPFKQVVDMSSKRRLQWEVEQLNKTIDFDCTYIKTDPTTFQLVNRTSISKVHGLFTILGIRRAYVTQLGKLVGVVGLKELRKAIQDVNSGNFSTEFTDVKQVPEVKSSHLHPRDLAFTNINSKSKSDGIASIETSIDSAGLG